MILSERYVEVPATQYLVRVTSRATRRLTTMEYLILRCVKTFSVPDSKMRLEKLSYVFEEVLHFVNSGLLIEPCLQELTSPQIQALKYVDSRKREYAEKRFWHIRLTERGQVFLKNGYLPGEEKVQNIMLWYTPLFQTIQDHEIYEEDGREHVPFTSRKEEGIQFPEERIFQLLSKGQLGEGKFIASKYRIESLEPISENEVTTLETLSILLNEDDWSISVRPETADDDIQKDLETLLRPKEITFHDYQMFPDFDRELPVKKIGSGTLIMNQMMELLSRSRIIIIQDLLYQRCFAHTGKAENKIFLIFHSKNYSVTKDTISKNIQITIPGAFPDPDCMMMTIEGTSSLCVTKTEFQYRNRPVRALLGYEKESLNHYAGALSQWLESIALSQSYIHPQAIALGELPGIRFSTAWDFLYKSLEDKTFEEITEQLQAINKDLLLMDLSFSNMKLFIPLLVKKTDPSQVEKALEQIGQLLTDKLVKENTLNHIRLVEESIRYLHPFGTLETANLFCKQLRIQSPSLQETASSGIRPDEKSNLISEIFLEMMTLTKVEIPDCFPWKKGLENYQKTLHTLEKALPGTSIFQPAAESQIQTVISNGNLDIQNLEAGKVALEKLEEELCRQGLDIQKEIRAIDSFSWQTFQENTANIQKAVASIRKDRIKADQAAEKCNRENKNSGQTAYPFGDEKSLYILDTCALIHQPELLESFTTNDRVIIPTVVMDELGKIKDNHHEKYDESASKIAREISWKVQTIQQNREPYTILLENAQISLLPKDLDPDVPDNKILSVALKHRQENPVLISNDRIFQITAGSQNIATLSGAEFMEQNIRQD